MTPYDNAKFYGYNSVEEYYEAQKHDNEIFFRGLEKKKPYVEKEPVKHGSWIKVQDKQGDYFLCSNCGTVEKTESGQDGAVWWHDEYCRKCGARMDSDTNG